MEDRLITYGGQAVIEGVLMRGRSAMALAVRLPDGSISVTREPLGGIYKSRLAKIPLLRGLILLWDSLGLGMRALTRSANLQSGEKDRLEGPGLWLTLVFSLLFAVGVFFLAPAGIGQLTESVFGWNSWWSNLVEGGVRLIFLIGYIWGIGFMPDIRRVFAYHGAEHKTINTYEAGRPLDPDTVAGASLEHPRCGTTFLVNVVLLSILLFTALGPLPIGWRLISRVLLIPVLAGLAYEYIRWTAGHLDSALVRALIKPSLAVQRLTTRPPDRDMLAVAIAALNAVRQQEAGQDAEEPG